MATPRSTPASLRRLPFVTLLSAALLLSGCSAIQVKLGLRVPLAKVPVSALAVSLPGDPGIAPGQKAPLIVTVTEPNGKVLLTSGKGHGKVMWKDLQLTTTLVTADKKGNLRLAYDPRLSDGKLGHLTVTAPSHPGLSAQLDIPVNYNYPFRASFYGSTGSSGFNGTDGIAGSSGSPGSTDPSNPSAGGAGGNGTNGTNGSNGGDGCDGPAVTVFATLRPGAHPLLQCGVTAAGHKTYYYLIDPTGGSLTVTSNGGSGGSGGKGGRGGAGGTGGPGIPPGSDGTAGTDGSDGQAGSDGSGGPITLTYDPSVQPYLSAIRLSNPGGPRPVLQQAPVAPLW